MPTADTEIDKKNPNYNCHLCLKNEQSKDEQCFCKGFFSLSLKSVHFLSDRYRDLLIKISLQCRETELTSFVDSTDDLDILLSNNNPILNELFENAFVETSYCKKIETIKWSHG